MKVLFVHCTYRFKGGEDTVVAEEMKLLEASGVETSLLVFNNDKGALLNLLQLPFNIPAYRKTVQALQQFKPDVVHVHNLHFAASPSVLKAVKSRNIPLVMTLHNFRLLCPSATLYHKGQLFLNSIHQTFPITAALKGVYKNSVPLTFWMSLCMQLHQWLRVWHLPDHYITLSEHARSIFLHSKMKFAPEKIVVKPNFCYAPLMAPAERNNYFLYVGRLTEEKGIRVMMKAFAATGFQLKMAGDGPLREEVVQFCAVHPNVEYLSSQPKEAVFKLLGSCTALMFPSTWYEGMPLTIIEAFACGTPVIASKLGAMETMIVDGSNGLHFAAGNEADLIEKTKQWQQFTETDRSAYRNNCTTTYQQLYTPDANREQLLQLYNQLISENAAQD